AGGRRADPLAQGDREESLHEPLPEIEADGGAPSGGDGRTAGSDRRRPRAAGARRAERLPGAASRPEPGDGRIALPRGDGVGGDRQGGGLELVGGEDRAPADPLGAAGVPRPPPGGRGGAVSEPLIARWLEDRDSLTEGEAAELLRALTSDPALAR